MSATTTVSFRLPDLGEGVAESEIVRWLIKPGDQIVEDQPMVEVMTDKATVEIPAPVTGVVATLCARDGEVVAVGSVIVEIEADESAASSVARSDVRDAAPAAPGTVGAGAIAAPVSGGKARGQRVQATPLVRRLAQELGVDLSDLAGTGPNGRISESDVRAAAGTNGGSAIAFDSPSSAAYKSIPLVGMRRAIGQHLSAAARVPTVTVVEDADLTSVDLAREKSGHSYMPYIVAAVVSGLREVPNLNAQMSADASELHVFGDIHAGIAVQTDGGLVVPVLRDAQTLSLQEIEAGVDQLAQRARDGKLTPADTRGGTFTVTSAGKFGGLFTNPLLNVPEVGIFGLHRAELRPVIVEGEVVVRRRANVSVTFDHRAVDGIDASRFLLAVVASLAAAK